MSQEAVSHIHIGCKVTSKKTGYPGVGQVVSVSVAGWWLAHNPSPSSYFIWDALYPEWKDKVIINVYFEEPRKPYSKEDLKIRYPDKDDSYFQALLDLAPEIRTIAYPIDDLEYFDECTASD